MASLTERISSLATAIGTQIKSVKADYAPYSGATKDFDVGIYSVIAKTLKTYDSGLNNWATTTMATSSINPRQIIKIGSTSGNSISNMALRLNPEASITSQIPIFFEIRTNNTPSANSKNFYLFQKLTTADIVTSSNDGTGIGTPIQISTQGESHSRPAIYIGNTSNQLIGLNHNNPSAFLDLRPNDSSSNTDFLINPTTKSSGNLIDLQIAGSSKFYVNSLGNFQSSGYGIVKEYFMIRDSSSSDEATIRFSKPYYGRLNFAIPIANSKAEVRYCAKGSTGGNGNLYFVVGSSETGDTGNNLVLGVAASRAFLTNASNYATGGTLHIGGYSWATDGVVRISGNANFSDTGKGVVQVDGAITFTSSLAVNNSYRGWTETGTVGENVAFGDILYLKFSDGKWWKAKADSYATTPGMRMALATITANNSGILLVKGNVRYDSWSLSDSRVYTSSATAGAITSTKPSTTGNQIQLVGIALTSTTLFFSPSIEVFTV